MAEEEVIVPTTLEEAFDHLGKLDGIEDFKTADPAEFHHGLGRWIRNNWGFWTGKGPLFAWFVSLGITHPDDMSGIILESFHRKLHDKPLDVEGQVQHYKDYWKKAEEE